MAKSDIMIDNDKTRVTRWLFEPGEDTGEHIHEYDYIVVNKDVEKAVEDISEIIIQLKNKYIKE